MFDDLVYWKQDDGSQAAGRVVSTTDGLAIVELHHVNAGTSQFLYGAQVYRIVPTACFVEPAFRYEAHPPHDPAAVSEAIRQKQLKALCRQLQKALRKATHV